MHRATQRAPLYRPILKIITKNFQILEENGYGVTKVKTVF